MTAILDRKCWEFCTFLPTECPSRGFGTAMTPPLAPPWSKLFSRNQKWCSRTSTLFFFRLEGGVFVVASSFKALSWTGHGNVHFYQHFSAPVLFFILGRFRSSLIASFKKTKWLAVKPTKIEKLTKVFLLNYVRCMAREGRRHKAIALTT